jgi:hypothetical protein
VSEVGRHRVVRPEDFAALRPDDLEARLLGKPATMARRDVSRGAEVSRGWNAILDEAKALIDGGAREITLLGQNVNAWTGENDKGRIQGLDGLIRATDKFADQ